MAGCLVGWLVVCWMDGKMDGLAGMRVGWLDGWMARMVVWFVVGWMDCMD